MDSFWCRDCQSFVDRAHKCHLWRVPIRIPQGAIATAKAEALMEAAERAIRYFDDFKICVPPAKYKMPTNILDELRAAILADEPKEERGAEVGDLVWWVSHREAHVARADRELIEAFAEVSRDAGPIVLMRRAEVERRIKEEAQ